LNLEAIAVLFSLRYLAPDKHSLELTDIIYILIFRNKIKMKFNFYQIYKIIFLLLIANISNLYAHNLINGGCKEHCLKNFKVINNEKKLNYKNNQMNIESKNSCLKKSLCRG